MRNPKSNNGMKKGGFRAALSYIVVLFVQHRTGRGKKYNFRLKKYNAIWDDLFVFAYGEFFYDFSPEGFAVGAV